MDTIQGNRTIAKLMGFYDSPYPNTPHKMYRMEESGEYGVFETNFSYNTSWNSFMPAYNKFRSEVISPVLYEDLPKEVIEKWEKLEMSILTCDIRYAFEKLVELINWKKQ